MIDRLKNISPFWYLTIAAFLVLIASTLFQHGYFMDGLLYSTIARNMSVGIGDIWHPHFTDTTGSAFHESLPLGMYLESVFFSIFGDHYWVEKVYSIAAGLLHLLFLIKIWKLINRKDESISKLSWIPALLWVNTAMIFWSFTNNMLENTSGLFALLAVYLTLKGALEKQLKWLVIAGVVIVLAGLSKSVMSLFPLGAYFLYWISNKHEKIGKAALQQIIIIVTFVAFLAVLLLIEPVRYNLLTHWDVQLSPSLGGDKAVSSHRYDIIVRLFFELIPMMVLALLFYFIGKGKASEHIKWKSVLFFILVGLSASVPFMLSPKQSGYYLVPCIPYFALGFGMIMAPTIGNLLAKKNNASNGWKVFRLTALVICFAAFVFVFIRPGKYTRHEERIVAVEVFASHLPKGSTICVCPSVRGDYPFLGYMYRRNYVSFDLKEDYEYFLSDGTCTPDGCAPLKSSGKYTLYQKRN
jgi:hypothetical protein